MYDSGGCVYILTNKNLTTLYTGSTNDIFRRYDEHLNHFYPNAFSARYQLYSLVFLLYCDSIYEAREIEYFIKGKSRQWKIDLIEIGNPYWGNLWKIIESDDIEEYFSKYDEFEF
jgi:putative endonuclease